MKQARRRTRFPRRRILLTQTIVMLRLAADRKPIELGGLSYA